MFSFTSIFPIGTVLQETFGSRGAVRIGQAEHGSAGGAHCHGPRVTRPRTAPVLASGELLTIPFVPAMRVGV